MKTSKGCEMLCGGRKELAALRSCRRHHQTRFRLGVRRGSLTLILLFSRPAVPKRGAQTQHGVHSPQPHPEGIAGEGRLRLRLSGPRSQGDAACAQ